MTDRQPEAQTTAEAEAHLWALLVAKARQTVATDPELGAKAAQLDASPGWDAVIISEIDVPELVPVEQSPVADLPSPPEEQPAPDELPPLAELLADSAVAQDFESAVQAEVQRIRDADSSLWDIPDDQLAELLTEAAEADYQSYVEQS